MKRYAINVLGLAAIWGGVFLAANFIGAGSAWVTAEDTFPRFGYVLFCTLASVFWIGREHI